MVIAPVDKPVTTPTELILAIAELLLLQMPDGVTSVNVTTPPTHIELTPVMDAIAGIGLIAMVFVANAVPQALVTV